jgi:hypothetical protein
MPRKVLTAERSPVTSEPLPGAAGVEHLTAALRLSGGLGEGWVREVVVESSRPTLLSRIIRLRLTCDRRVGAPSSLILKTALPDRVADLWSRPVRIACSGIPRLIGSKQPQPELLTQTGLRHAAG